MKHPHAECQVIDTAQLRKLAQITTGYGNATMNRIAQDAGVAINECCDTIDRMTAERDALRLFARDMMERWPDSDVDGGERLSWQAG